LFDVKENNITYHIQGIFKTHELDPESTTQKIRVVRKEGNTQYEPIDVIKFTNAHDRFLMIDETVYHIGASLKDLGKKWFAFSKMDITSSLLLSKM
jgi:hypothetical protein